MKDALLTLILALAAATLSAGELEVEYWKLELPPGHVHMPKRGIDSVVGEIISEKNQFRVTYDIGVSAGLVQEDWVGNLDRIEDFQVPAGIGRLYICKPDDSGKRKVRFGLPPHFNMSATGPADTVLKDFKALLAKLSFKDPLPPETLDCVDARFVNGEKGVEITISSPNEAPLGRASPPGSFRFHRAYLTESGKFREIGTFEPGQSRQVLLELAKYPGANLVIQGSVATKTGFRSSIGAIGVPELLARTKDRERR